MSFIQAVPAAGVVAADLIAGKLDIEDSETLAKRLKTMVPPQALQDEDGVEEGPQIPPQVQQAIELMAADFEALQKAHDEALAQLKSKEAENETKLTIAQINSATDMAVARMTAEVDLAIAGIRKEIDQLKIMTPTKVDIT
jgi:hypothetical protein